MIDINVAVRGGRKSNWSWLAFQAYTGQRGKTSAYYMVGGHVLFRPTNERPKMSSGKKAHIEIDARDLSNAGREVAWHDFRQYVTAGVKVVMMIPTGVVTYYPDDEDAGPPGANEDRSKLKGTWIDHRKPGKE